MKKIFVDKKINIAFHAAAYKHVPLVESNPLEGVYNNVISTKVICLAAKYASLKKVILISTDKAVRPTSIMGFLKDLQNLLFSHLLRKSHCKKIRLNQGLYLQWLDLAMF